MDKPLQFAMLSLAMKKSLCPLFLSSVALLATLAPRLCAEETSFFRIPKMGTPPVMDGAFSEGEWDGAMSYTGLGYVLVNGALAPEAQQVVITLGYDDTYLYMAMNSPYPHGRYPMARTTRNDSADVFADDSIEWQLTPFSREEATKPGFGFFKITANPLGAALTQHIYRDDIPRPWEGGIDWETGGALASTVTTNGWQYECSVAWKNIGIIDPDGKTLFMHHVRSDSSSANRAMVATVGAFWTDWARFAEFVLDPEAPAVQLLSLGEPSKGAVQTEWKVTYRGNWRSYHIDMRATNDESAYYRMFSRVKGFMRISSGKRNTITFSENMELDKLPEKNTSLTVQIKSSDVLLWKHVMRIDQFTEAQLQSFVTNWIGAMPMRPPEGVGEVIEIPDSPLAQLAAQRKDVRTRDEDDDRLPMSDEDIARWSSFKPTPQLPKAQTVWVDDGNVGINAEWRVPYAVYVGSAPRPVALASQGRDALPDLYDNRDGDHSNLQWHEFPDLTWIEYSDNARDAKLNMGIPNIFHEGIVIGNASLAVTSGKHWRSMARKAHQTQEGADWQYHLYTHNKLYVYPGHYDFLPGRNGVKVEDKQTFWGDVYPFNSPYCLSSVGSSCSDLPFLRAYAETLAAFDPCTKRCLEARGLVAPTMQMILRSSLTTVKDPEDYLTGVAHPMAFRGETLDVEKMKRMARNMNTNTLPALIQLNVTQEGPASEIIFTTPCSIARVFREKDFWRTLTVDASGTKDLNGHKLTYRWVVLNGDASKVKDRKSVV